jgi:hypothetical protein
MMISVMLTLESVINKNVTACDTSEAFNSGKPKALNRSSPGGAKPAAAVSSVATKLGLTSWQSDPFLAEHPKFQVLSRRKEQISFEQILCAPYAPPITYSVFLGRHFLVVSHWNECPTLAFRFSSFTLTCRKMHYCWFSFFVDLRCSAGAEHMFADVWLATDERLLSWHMLSL